MNIKKILWLNRQLLKGNRLSIFISIIALSATMAMMTVFFMTYARESYFSMVQALMGEQYTDFFEPVEDGGFSNTVNTLFMLTAVCMIVSILGIMALLYLKGIKQTHKNMIMKVCGFRPVHEWVFSFLDSMYITLISAIIGTGFGVFLFFITANTLVGMDFQFNTSISGEIISILAKNFVVFFPTLFFVHIWMYKRLGRISIVDVLQKRPITISQGKSVIWVILGILITILHLNMFAESSIWGLLAIIIAIIIMYALFRLGFNILRKFNFSLNSISSLSFLLLTRRKQFTAMIGTAIVVLFALCIMVYNIVIGINRYLENLWDVLNGYNTVVELSNENYMDFALELDSHEIPFYIVYTTLIPAVNAPHDFPLAGLRDDKNIVPHLIPSRGEFFANRYFLGELGLRNIMPRHTEPEIFSREFNYSFFNNDFTLSGAVLDMFGGHPGFYVVAINYLDIPEDLIKDYNNIIILNLTNSEQAFIKDMAAHYNGVVYTSNDLVYILRESISHLIIYFNLTAGILTGVIIIFLVSIVTTATISRKREFILYFVMGINKRVLQTLVTIENALIIFVALIMIFGLNFLLFNAISGFFAGTFAYTLSIFDIFGLLCILSLVIGFITWVAIRIISLWSVTDVLRVEE